MQPEPVTFDVAGGITAIDTFMGGRERYTAAYLVRGPYPTLIETGPTTSVEAVTRSLAALGLTGEELANIVLTHIHLDHAGGVGALGARFPTATIHVHERGAPHLVDPTRLVASAARVYGEPRMASLFGSVHPVAADRIRQLADGDTVDVGDRALEVMTTPGHASHHVAIVEPITGVVFTGDALGIHVPDLPVLRPATPPPDFDLELAVASIRAIRDRRPSSLLFAHFGPIDQVARACELAERRMRDWVQIVRLAMRETSDLDSVVKVLTDEVGDELALGDDLSPSDRAPTGADAQLNLDRLETLSSIRMNAMGIMRYWSRKAELSHPGEGRGTEPPALSE